MPWNSPVFCAHDKEYNFYWISSTHSLHSTNIEVNKNVALVVYDSTKPEGQGFGVYIKATAGIVNDEPELEHALRLLNERGRKPPLSLADVTGETPRKVYKAVPTNVWVNDIASKKEDDKLKYFRIEIKLT